MSTMIDLVNRYIASWNEPADEARRALVARTFSEKARYVDPLMEGEGHDGIDAMIRAVQTRFPDHRFTLTGAVDHHKRYVRFSWLLAAPGKPPIAGGTDFCAVAADDRLEAVTGFLDQVTNGAKPA
ncbi:Putative isomerase [Minicystis rosea]|nr:Putative isomerase [Minicystis rosea]